MVCFGGLEFVAAGYLLAEHSRRKKEEQRLEQEEAWRQQALQRYSPRHQKPPHTQQRRPRRHSEGEKDDRRYRNREWSEPRKEKRPRDEHDRQRKERHRDESRDTHSHRDPRPAPAHRHADPAASKHQPRQYLNSHAIPSTTTLNAPFHLTNQPAPPHPHSHLHRTGSDPPPSRPPHSPRHSPAPPAHDHWLAHNSIFRPVPPHVYRSSPLSQSWVPAPTPSYPTYHPPSPPSPPPPASAMSSRPQYHTPSPPANMTALALPPPPDGVWELPASDVSKMTHPNPAQHHHDSHHRHHHHHSHHVDEQYNLPLRPRAASSGNPPPSSLSRGGPHVRFADGLDVHENIAEPPPPYREF